MNREVLANIFRSYAGTAHSPEDVVGAILAAIDQSDQAAAERLLGLYLEGKLPAGDVKIMLDNLRLGPRICQICTVTEYVCPACSGLEADLAAALEEVKQLKGRLASRDRGLARQAWLLKNANTNHRPAHRAAAERAYIDRLMALEQRVEGLEVALRPAHGCATLREDGTCDGCIVSEALRPAKETT